MQLLKVVVIKKKLGRPPNKVSPYRLSSPKTKINYTFAMKKKIIKNICKLYVTSGSTIQSACNAYGISYTLFWKWRDLNKLLQLIYEECKLLLLQILKDRMVNLAIKAQKKALLGYDLLLHLLRTLLSVMDLSGNTTKTVIRKTKKRVLPTVKDTSFILTHLDKDFRPITLIVLDDLLGDDLILTADGIMPNEQL